MKSDLRTQIFEYLKTLKKGETTTYKFLAEKFNSHPRAIAQILKSNKNKDVPCYKVIKSDGERFLSRSKINDIKNPREVARLLGGYNNLLGKSKKELLKKEGLK